MHVAEGDDLLRRREVDDRRKARPVAAAGRSPGAGPGFAAEGERPAVGKDDPLPRAAHDHRRGRRDQEHGEHHQELQALVEAPEGAEVLGVDLRHRVDLGGQLRLELRHVDVVPGVDVRRGVVAQRVLVPTQPLRGVRIGPSRCGRAPQRRAQLLDREQEHPDRQRAVGGHGHDRGHPRPGTQGGEDLRVHEQGQEDGIQRTEQGHRQPSLEVRGLAEVNGFLEDVPQGAVALTGPEAAGLAGESLSRATAQTSDAESVHGDEPVTRLGGRAAAVVTSSWKRDTRL